MLSTPWKEKLSNSGEVNNPTYCRQTRGTPQHHQEGNNDLVRTCHETQDTIKDHHSGHC